MSSGLSIKQLDFADADAAARIHRASFDHALPWLAGLHTPDQDLWFYRERVFATCTVWGAFEGHEMRGVIAFRDDWIEQLYILPEAQGRGLGSQLLDIAKRSSERLQLWTFLRNVPARRFYEARGFVLVVRTDGARNEEKEPDARYLWTRG
ncbi:GNAT family N-acetyltransferase [Bradyrhizobium roseum]|uniref:GNAT family N-acetyltransferase n=1 Tax=Bradyrhizobium roseum TaxID=3056648 RepID=UPI00260C09A8|nr:GNAT family N-acetyltransferase [Bradyrhizobium roseus]WKA32002.1 GNAT family N-acetyltransferase [Bradyrhizobium roseus]